MAVQLQTAHASLAERLEARGFTRRDFLKYCGSLAVMLGLSQAAAPQVAEALEIGEKSGKLLPVIWMEGGSCSGCTESLAQTNTPDIAELVLETISLNYTETLSAAAGHTMEQARKDTIEAGGYVLVYEGAVPTAYDGNVLMVGGEKGIDSLAETAEKANAVIALGSCACDGGWMAARPNDAASLGVQKFLSDKGIDTPVVNIPCCPANPEWLVAVIVQYALMGTLPELNSKNEPVEMFNQTVHDNCPRRGHFENGEFVYQFGSAEEAKGYCLYPLGCRGPQTFTNCPITRWNRSLSWCVEAGAPCIGCGNINPMHPQRNWVDESTPFLQRHRDISLGDFHFQPPAAALAFTVLVVGVLAVHAVGMKVAGRVDGGADFEPERRWDVKHGTPAAHEAGARAAKLYDGLDAEGLEPKNIKRFRRIREAKKAGLDPKAALGFKVEHASEEPAAANDDAMKGGEE